MCNLYSSMDEMNKEFSRVSSIVIFPEGYYLGENSAAFEDVTRRLENLPDVFATLITKGRPFETPEESDILELKKHFKAYGEIYPQNVGVGNFETVLERIRVLLYRRSLPEQRDIYVRHAIESTSRDRRFF